MVCRCASDQFVTEHRFRHTTYLLPFPIIMCQFWVSCFHICFVWSSPNLHLLGYSSTKRNLVIRIVWSGKVQNKWGRYFSRGSGVREPKFRAWIGPRCILYPPIGHLRSVRSEHSRQVSIILLILQSLRKILKLCFTNDGLWSLGRSLGPMDEGCNWFINKKDESKLHPVKLYNMNEPIRARHNELNDNTDIYTYIYIYISLSSWECCWVITRTPHWLSFWERL